MLRFHRNDRGRKSW